MKWTRTGKTVSAKGTTIFYSCAEDPKLTIESRKEHIPHANRSGTWDFTSYWVLWDGEEIKQLYTLADAKEYAELVFREKKWMEERR